MLELIHHLFTVLPVARVRGRLVVAFTFLALAHVHCTGSLHGMPAFSWAVKFSTIDTTDLRLRWL